MELQRPVEIPDRMFFRIGEVAEIAGVKPHVLRYWESEFSFLAPKKNTSQQRLYSRLDVENILLIKHLLYDLKFSIAGAKKRFFELRRKGELKEERKVKLVITKEKFEQLEQAKQSLRELIEFCK